MCGSLSTSTILEPATVLASLGAQAVDEAIQLVERTELDRQFAHLFHPSVALHALLDADIDLRGEQVGEFFFQPAQVA